MNNRDFNKLKQELKLKAFPPRPKRLVKCGVRHGEPVYRRKTTRSYFQILEADPKPYISLEAPPRRRGSKFTHRINCNLMQSLYDYICDKLFS